MTFLRDRFRRSWPYQYFAIMEPGDRATALIVLALLLAWAIAFAVIVRTREPAISSAPRFTAPPFLMDFAEARP